MATERFDIQVVFDTRLLRQGNQTVQRELKKTQKEADNLRTVIREALNLFIAFRATKGLLELADTFNRIENRIRVVTAGQEELRLVTQDLFEVAQRTRSSFEGTAELYARLAINSRQLGRTQEQLVEFTESVNQAVILSGASFVEARAGLIQFSQALASGVLRGDELRSVLEQLPIVADVIAKQLGVTRGELRELGADGKLTAEVIIEAFENAKDSLEKRFGRTVPTLGQSFEVFRNSLIKVIGDFDQITGASVGLSKAILLIADNLEFLLPVLAAVAFTLEVILAKQAIGFLLKQLKLLNAVLIANPWILVGAAIVAATVAIFEFANAERRAIEEADALTQATRNTEASLRQIASIKVNLKLFEDKGDARGIVEALEQQLAIVRNFRQELVNGGQTPTLTEAELKNLFLDPAQVKGLSAELGKEFEGLAKRLSLGAHLNKTGQDVANILIPADLPELFRAKIAALEKQVANAKLRLPPVITAEDAQKAKEAFAKFQTDLQQQAELAAKSGAQQEQLAAKFKVLDLAARGAFAGLEQMNAALDSTSAQVRELQQARAAAEFDEFTEKIAKENEILRAQTELLGAGKSALEAERELLEVVNAAKSAGLVISEEEIAALRQELITRNELQASLANKDTRQSVIEDLEREIELLHESTGAREVLIRQRQIENELLQSGIKLSEQERQNVQLLLEEIQALEARNKVIEEANGNADEFARRQQAIKDALLDGQITTDQSAAAFRRLREEQLELGTTAADGFQLGTLKVIESLTDLSSVAEQTVVNAFGAAEDAFVNFVKTGKLEFGSLVESVLEDLTRLLFRKALLALLDTLFPGAGAGAGAAASIAGAATGALNTRANQPFIVGEEGPELIVPPTGSDIIPNEETMGMVGSQQAPIVNVQPPPPPVVLVSVINVTDPEEVGRYINSGKADKALVNRVGANKSAVNNRLA